MRRNGTAGSPLGGQGVRVAEAAEPAFPNTRFLTKEALLELCEETNSGRGMLATGTDSDVKLRINFGQRPKAANYYKDWSPAKGTAASGITTWLVVGSEKFTPESQTEETDGLVLYSEAPLIGCDYLNGATKKAYSRSPALTRPTPLLQIQAMASMGATGKSIRTTGARVTCGGC